MGSSSLNGSMPAIISYVRIPRHHQSTGLPWPERSSARRTFVEQNLGGEVLGRAAERVGAALAVLREAEVSQLQVAELVDEQVLGLQVAVYDVLRVQVVEHEHNLRRVEPTQRSDYSHMPKMYFACSGSSRPSVRRYVNSSPPQMYSSVK